MSSCNKFTQSVKRCSNCCLGLQWEGKVERSQEEFERISRAIKKEMEQFDVMRVKDFRDMVIKYLEDLMTSQQQVGSLCCVSCSAVILLKVHVILR